VPTNSLELSRDYDLPVSIVWDALVDEVLVEGWLAAARIDARVGGEYLLSWMSGLRLDPTNGVITALESGRRLAIDTDNIGSLEFVLDAVAGGTRGTATQLRLTISVDTDHRLLASTHAYWQTNFDQLEDLLRGHPVDWTTWQKDRGEAWAAHLATASRWDRRS
jgi:uncharacterized protein YndB with AHSA1/START domain